jgi:hypothetical protein
MIPARTRANSAMTPLDEIGLCMGTQPNGRRSGHEVLALLGRRPQVVGTYHPPDPPPVPSWMSGSGAAVWDLFRSMACPTESDLECDSTLVVRKSRRGGPRCRT